MANGINPVGFLYMTFVILSAQNLVAGKPMVPCHFIFGDSLSDNGNNNDLNTLAKANYAPYGYDFPQGPTGRFTDGRTISDIIDEKLGFEDYIPPFSTANGSEILQGVNYASGSAGILDETGRIAGICISFRKQIARHKRIVSRINHITRSKKITKQHLHKCLYSLNIGSNDYINNYFLTSFYNTSQRYTTRKFAKLLVRIYSNGIRRLYKYGARKMYLVGLGKIGCTPNAKKVYGTDKTMCASKLNNAAIHFNERLKSLVHRLNKVYKTGKFVYIDTNRIALAYSTPPASTKFKLTPCCQTYETGKCIPGTTPCRERNISLFWDAFHPSEVINRIQADKMFSSLDPTELFPMNIQQLAKYRITKN